MSIEQSAQAANWFYEENGQRAGPVSEPEMIQLIKSSKITQGASVWKQGSPDWVKVENSELAANFDKSLPPPLSGEHINNTIVWVLAFAPLIGYFLEWIFAGILNSKSEYAMQAAMDQNKYFFVTVALNIALGILDEKKLKAAGHNTDKFKGWVWVVPVYLFQRAKATKQNLAYFIVWIVCFLAVLSA